MKTLFVHENSCALVNFCGHYLCQLAIRNSFHKNSPKMSTRIHTKHVHENSWKVSRWTHPFCQRKFAFYVHENSATPLKSVKSVQIKSILKNCKKILHKFAKKIVSKIIQNPYSKITSKIGPSYLNVPQTPFFGWILETPLAPKMLVY